MNKYLFLLFFLCVSVSMQAKISLPAYFTDNMIVQQKSMLTISGVSAAGKEVVVKVGWNSKDFRVTSGMDGKFEVQVPTPKAGGPYTITMTENLFSCKTYWSVRSGSVLDSRIWKCRLPVGGK